MNGARFRVLRMLKKLNRKLSLAFSPKTPVPGNPNSLTNATSRSLYCGPRNTFRPIPGLFENALPPGITELKYLLHPGATLQFAPAIKLFGKIPPGDRKFAFVLLSGCGPKNSIGRRLSQKLTEGLELTKQPPVLGVHGNPL